MNTIQRFTTLIIGVFLLASCAATALNANLSKFKSLPDARGELNDLQFSEHHTQQYEKYVLPAFDKPLRAYNDVELHHLFTAQHELAFYSTDQYFENLIALYTELEQRQAISEGEIDSMFNAYIAYRRLEPAREIARRYDYIKFAPIPELRDKSSKPLNLPTALFFDRDNPVLTRKDFPLSGKQIIVVFHPYCHFSAYAFNAIAADADLAPVFAQFSTWMMPTNDSTFDISIAQRWQKEYPQLKAVYSYRSDEWPQITSWSLPNFYFLNDGKVVAHIEGWPKEGRKAELQAAIAKWQASEATAKN